MSTQDLFGTFGTLQPEPSESERAAHSAAIREGDRRDAESRRLSRERNAKDAEEGRLARAEIQARIDASQAREARVRAMPDDVADLKARVERLEAIVNLAAAESLAARGQ